MGERYGAIHEMFINLQCKDHERSCRINSDVFCGAVYASIDDEQALRPPDCPNSATWDTIGDNDANQESEQDDQRLGLCLLAFEVIPTVCGESFSQLVEATKHGEGQKYISRNLNHVLANPEKIDLAMRWLEEISLEHVKVGDDQFLLIRFPCPSAAPEPNFLAAHFEQNLEDSDRAYRLLKIYSCEMAALRPYPKWLLCELRTDLRHSILGDLSDPTTEVFFRTINKHISEYSMLDCSSSVIDHLLLYTEISSRS